jgi:hypothetical protein
MRPRGDWIVFNVAPQMTATPVGATPAQRLDIFASTLVAAGVVLALIAAWPLRQSWNKAQVNIA